jgi:hypothetical protein
MDRKKQQVPPLRFHGSPGQVAPVPSGAGTGGMTVSFKSMSCFEKLIRSQTLGAGGNALFISLIGDPEDEASVNGKRAVLGSSTARLVSEAGCS